MLCRVWTWRVIIGDRRQYILGQLYWLAHQLYLATVPLIYGKDLVWLEPELLGLGCCGLGSLPVDFMYTRVLNNSVTVRVMDFNLNAASLQV
ncbi:hypothetical protein [Nostoc sp. FACHB-133]|uniref:hypothetical protein n=1 Tax=Nostoc sp. FACHB-133 TaxID=2692835 RepID=UPI0016834389|nr:hypothetical protein [Nostoc sp. FACHB-133]MBD2525563.1 hypothetical protein [Nostoc sp. FACHB-133]